MEMQLHVVGLGIEQPVQLNQSAIEAIKHANWIIGSERQLALVEPIYASQPSYTKILPKLSALKTWLLEEKPANHERVVILASGDPLFFGIGAWVKRHFEQADVNFYPGVSSIQAACHQLGLSLQDVTVVSVHGRPINHLKRELRANRILALLTDNQSSPANIAQQCIELGFSDAKIVVCERLGYDDQNVSSFKVTDPALQSTDFDALHVSIVFTHQSQVFVPEFPGIPDTEFITDKGNGKGLITKREVRLNILSMLQIQSGDCVWDVGAGCGSIAVEGQRWCPSAKVYAIECNEDRVALINQNAMRFGVAPLLQIITGYAPMVLEALPTPQKIFVGGSGDTLCANLEYCWQRLNEGGVLLVSAVTEHSKYQCTQFFEARRQSNDSLFESTQIAVSRAGELAGSLLFRPNLPVTLYKWIKTEENNKLISHRGRDHG